MPQHITPELRRWIIEQVQAGCSVASVLQAMRVAGWQEPVALQALESTLAQHLSQRGVNVDAVLAAQSVEEVQALVGEAAQALANDEQVPQTPDAGRHTLRAHKAVPEPDLSGSPRQLDVGDQVVDVLLSMARPRVVVLGNFLSPDECDGLIALARPRMARSLTVETASGGEAVNPDRTSQGMFFRRGENDLVARIEARIARLTRWPVEKGEGIQVLHYRLGAQYKPHYDYFDPAAPGTPTLLKRGGQRVGTLVMYLNNPERGGGTTFPDVGLEVCPQKGHAVFFSYERAHPSSQTLHGGAPVVAGEKWVATKWMRENEFV